MAFQIVGSLKRESPSFYDSDEEMEKTHDEQNLQKRKKKYKIKFRPAWCRKFQWLIQDDSPQGKMCIICGIKISGNLFHIQRHAASDLHKRAESDARKDTPKLFNTTISTSDPHKRAESDARKNTAKLFSTTIDTTKSSDTVKSHKKSYEEYKAGKITSKYSSSGSDSMSDSGTKYTRKCKTRKPPKGDSFVQSKVKFRQIWCQRFKWLKQDDSPQGKMCIVCGISVAGNLFHLERHAASDMHRKAKREAKKKRKSCSFTESDSTESVDSVNIRMKKQKVPKKEKPEGKTISLKSFLSQDSSSTPFQGNQTFVEVHARPAPYEETAEIDYDHHTIKAFEKYFVEDSEQKIEYEDDNYVEEVTDAEYMDHEANDESLENQNFLREEGTKSEKITMSILYFLCRDMYDLKFIEGKGFIRFMNEVAPYYSIPSTVYMKSKLFELYNTTALNYKQKIEKASYLTLTLDIWINAKMEKTCLGVTVHFLEGLKRINCNIATKELQPKPNASYLSNMLKSILKKWNIQSAKIKCIICDSGSNITTAARSIVSEKNTLPCLLRNIDTVVETGLRTNDIKVIISKVRAILKWSQNFIMNSEKWAVLYSQSKILEDSTRQFTVDTRWNAVYCMLERFLELKSICLQLSLGDYTSPEMPTELEIAIIKEAKTILQPFECLSKECLNEDGGYIALSKIIPVLNCLKIKLLSFDSSYDPIITLRESLLTETDKKFSNFLGMECNTNAAIATLLDPRFKNIHFQYESSCNRAVQQLKELMRLEKPTKSEMTPPPSKCDLWQYHRDLLVKQNQYKNIDKEDEISLYLAYPVSALKSSPLEDWEDMKSIFPTLYKQARKFLSIVASSSNIEDANEKRNSLTSSHIEKILFLRNVSESVFF